MKNLRESQMLLECYYCCIHKEERTATHNNKSINFFLFITKDTNLVVCGKSRTASIFTDREIRYSQRTFLLRSASSRLVQGRSKTFNHFRFFLVLLSRDLCKSNKLQRPSLGAPIFLWKEFKFYQWCTKFLLDLLPFFPIFIHCHFMPNMYNICNIFWISWQFLGFPWITGPRYDVLQQIVPSCIQNEFHSR